MSALIGLSACSEGAEVTEFAPTVDPNDVVPDPSPESMSDFLRENSDYGTLLRLIEEADLASELQGENSGMGWTLFAPSDSAFVNDEFESLARQQRVSLIRSHLYSGRISFDELVPGPLVMSEGRVEVQQLVDEPLSIGGATIVARDRVVANGIIHFVSSIVSPVP